MAKAKYRTREYQIARAAIDKAQARGEILVCVEPVCLHPTRAILPNQRAHVCHDPTGTVITGPGHARCNTSEGATRGNRMRDATRLRW